MGWDTGRFSNGERLRNGGHLFPISKGFDRPHCPLSHRCRLFRGYPVRADHDSFRGVRRGYRGQMAAGWQRAPTSIGRTEVRWLARQANRRDFCQSEPHNFHTDQPPDHSIPDHAQYGQSIYARCELRRGGILGSWRVLEHVDWDNPFLVLERARWMRRGSCPPETAGIRLRVLAGDDLRQSLLLVHLLWLDDRTGEKFRQSELSSMGRPIASWRDRQHFGHRTPTSSTVQRGPGTVPAGVAQESGQPELESSLVSRAAYGIHNPALLLALRHPVFCLFRRHELVFDWCDSGCKHRMDCRSLFLSYFHSAPDDSAAKLHLPRLRRTLNACAPLALTATADMEMHDIVTGNFAPARWIVSAPKSLRIVDWKIERGQQLQGVTDFLVGVNADILILQEVDLNARRTHRLNIAETIARKLEMNYVFGREFQELAQGSKDSPAYHGQATLSKWPISKPRLIRFSRQSRFWQPRWFLPKIEPFQERLGGRVALVTQIHVAGRKFVTYNLHLESRGSDALRISQLGEVLPDTTCYDAECPVIVAGDLNLDASREPVALTLARAGFQDAVPSPRPPTTPAHGLFEGRRRIDWAFIRGPLRASSGQVHGDVKASDHYPISFILTA